ncbi:MAG: hypothetical protein ACREQ5_09715 [Candidatus Dormibacteria bacterium]
MLRERIENLLAVIVDASVAQIYMREALGGLRRRVRAADMVAI